MLNTTQTQRNRQARKDERKKLLLELSLILLLQHAFRAYSKEYKHQLKEGSIAPTIALQLAVSKILKKHYKRVSDDFSQQIIAELGKPHNHGDVRNIVETQTAIHAEIRANESAKIIAATTQKDAMNAWEAVRIEAEQRGEILTAEQHAARAQLKLDRKLAVRTPLISNIETQNAAEHAKQTEINALDSTDAIIDDITISSRPKFKQWIAMLDNRTRPWHADADGQIVPFNEPFVVNGENLMVPGDMSLGASIDNIANCRCSFVVIIK